jgi:hypothetical protein
MTFYFAWVDAEENEFIPAFEREDEKIYGFTLEHAEGEFPALSIEIKNPRIGLLAPGRKQWAWLAWNDGAQTIPLFFGRLIGIPSNILGEIVTLEFVAQPADYAAAKHELAQTLKTAPYYDPVFLDEAHRDDPDAILEGYTAAWHIDRVTHEVTISDWHNGEAGIEEFFADEVPYDSVSVTLAAPPQRSVLVEALVSWANASSGYVDFGARRFTTYCGESFISDWPKIGASVGGGWSVFHSECNDDFGIGGRPTVSTRYSWHNRAKRHAVGDTMSINMSYSAPSGIPPGTGTLLSQNVVIGVINPYDPDFTDQPRSSLQQSRLIVPLWQISTRLVLRYDAGRDRTEKLRFRLSADLQPLLADANAPAEEETLTLTGADVGAAIAGIDYLTGDTIAIEGSPIEDPSRNTYFATQRGLQSVEYCLMRARAKLALAARAVQISFDCRFARAAALSCRHSARLHDDRLPGGQAEGKIVAYRLSVDGDRGEMLGNVTIGCVPGNGGAPTPVDGVPVYVDEDVLEDGIQAYEGGSGIAASGDVAFSLPAAASNDAGLQFPLTRDQVVLREEVHGSPAAEEAALAPAIAAAVEAARMTGEPTLQNQTDEQRQARAGLSDALKHSAVWYELQLLPVDEEGLEATYELQVSSLYLPQQIDLAAPAA